MRFLTAALAAALEPLLPALLLAQAGASPPAAAPDTTPAKTPFAFANFTWLNGTTRQRSSLLGNQYYGYDTMNNPRRVRVHSDNSLEVKCFDQPGAGYDKGAFSVTMDAGCKSGGGVSCTSGSTAAPAQNFLGFMLYDRSWFAHDRYALTVGGGAMTNPGRYLVLMPPINGATATSGTPYFTANPDDSYSAWDASLTFDYMPDDLTTFRFELNHRAANVPYFSGPGGVTPPGGNTGAPGSTVPGWAPDLRNHETRLNLSLLIKL